MSDPMAEFADRLRSQEDLRAKDEAIQNAAADVDADEAEDEDQSPEAGQQSSESGAPEAEPQSQDGNFLADLEAKQAESARQSKESAQSSAQSSTAAGGSPTKPEGSHSTTNADANKQGKKADGEAMPNGTHKISDKTDLFREIRAAEEKDGDTSPEMNDLRKHILKRAKALGEHIDQENLWNADGTVKEHPEFQEWKKEYMTFFGDGAAKAWDSNTQLTMPADEAVITKGLEGAARLLADEPAVEAVLGDMSKAPGPELYFYTQSLHNFQTDMHKKLADHAAAPVPPVQEPEPPHEQEQEHGDVDVEIHGEF